MSYSVIMTCRDGESTIIEAVNSWLNQSVKPDKIIVVNDGSKDGSQKILEQLPVTIIYKPNTTYDVTRICHNWNDALQLVDTDYHVIATEDSSYHVLYAERILEVMKDENVFACSGVYDNIIPKVPNGIGRFVRQSMFRWLTWNGKYPYQCGFESAILYDALTRGHKLKVCKDAYCYHHRKLGTNHGFKEFVMADILLGHSKEYIIGRCMFLLHRRLINVRQLFALWDLAFKFKPSTGYYAPYPYHIREYIRSHSKI